MSTDLPDLASRLLVHLASSGKAPLEGLARDLGAAPKAIEDALGYLVRNEFLAKDFKLVDWTWDTYKKSRAKRMKAVQDVLFAEPELIQKRKRRKIGGDTSDYAVDTARVVSGPLTVMRTKDIRVNLSSLMSADKWMRDNARSLVRDGWSVKKWKEHKAIGTSPAHIIVTLQKEFVLAGGAHIEGTEERERESQSSQEATSEAADQVSAQAIAPGEQGGGGSGLSPNAQSDRPQERVQGDSGKSVSVRLCFS